MIEILDGGLIEKDPSDEFVAGFAWEGVIATGVEIASVAFAITGDDAVLTKSHEGSEDQMATLLLSAGTLGQRYSVACKIVTNETTPQTFERSFQVYVRQR